jgi:hypothetical protein
MEERCREEMGGEMQKKNAKRRCGENVEKDVEERCEERM